MKTLSKLSILLILIVIISSCKKNNPQPDNNIYWKVNGVSKSARPDASWFSGDSFMLEAKSGNDYINLYIDSNMYVRNFPLDDPFNGSLAEYKVGKNEDHYADNGSIRITYFDGNNVSGTFSFSVGSGSSKRDITEGSFTAKVHFYDFSDTTSYNDTLFNVMKIKRLALTNRKAGRTP